MFVFRNLKEKDADGMLEWMHDEETQKLFKKDMGSMTREKVLGFISSAKTTDTRSGNVHFAVADENDDYLGTVSLKNIDMEDLNAEYAVSMHMKARGTGAAAFATSEILKYGFEQLGLHRIYLNVLTTNLRANRFYQKMGFEFEGTSKECLYMNGRFESLNWYAIIKNDHLLDKESSV